MRTTGEKAFDIITIEPDTEFKEICMKSIEQFDSEINSMLVWAKICSLNQYKYKRLVARSECEFTDINKVVSLIPIYRILKRNEKINYFVHS